MKKCTEFVKCKCKQIVHKYLKTNHEIYECDKTLINCEKCNKNLERKNLY